MPSIRTIVVLCVLSSPLVAAGQTTAPASAPPAVKTGRKVEKPVTFIPARTDAFLGDWAGAQGDAGIVAQVFASPAGDIQANLLKSFDTENNVITTLKGTRSNDALSFSGDGWSTTLQGSHFTGAKGGGGDQHFDLHQVTRTSPTLGAAPPKDAIVLFDGHNFDAWAKKNGKDWLAEAGPAQWKLVDASAMEVVPGADFIITHQKFGDYHAHVEFRTLGTPTNSAVFLECRYEVKINETYGRLDGLPTGGFANCALNFKPRIRAAYPPLAWQTFDIDFRAPRFGADGKKVASARASVSLNGVQLYDNQELDPPNQAAGRLGEAPTGPLMLEEHGMPLQFRNIWLVETKSVAQVQDHTDPVSAPHGAAN